MDAKGVGYLCDEILRDESPAYVESLIRQGMLSYLDEEEFTGKSILDFGCGSGASTMVLCRLFPKAHIVGVELEEKFVAVARMRKSHWAFTNVDFVCSPRADSLPEDLGLCDYVVISSVWEHLLPQERQVLLPMLWNHLKSHGILFLHGTPHRYSLREGHTTGFPLINFLPDRLTYHIVEKWSRRASPNDTWETFLRRGIRGGTVREIMRTCKKSGGHPELLSPQRLGAKDRIDLWIAVSTRASIVNKCVKCAAKTIQAMTGITFSPWLTLAIRKNP